MHGLAWFLFCYSCFPTCWSGLSSTTDSQPKDALSPKSHQTLVCLQQSLPFTSVPNGQENLQASLIPPFQSLVTLPEVPNLVRYKTSHHSSTQGPRLHSGLGLCFTSVSWVFLQALPLPLDYYGYKGQTLSSHIVIGLSGRSTCTVGYARP